MFTDKKGHDLHSQASLASPITCPLIWHRPGCCYSSPPHPHGRRAQGFDLRSAAPGVLRGCQVAKPMESALQKMNGILMGYIMGYNEM